MVLISKFFKWVVKRNSEMGHFFPIMAGIERIHFDVLNKIMETLLQFYIM